MILNYSRKALMELYARNERQKERLGAVKERVQIAKDIQNKQRQVVHVKQAGVKGRIRNLLYRALLPCLDEQLLLTDYLIDELELLYGMEEDSMAERESVLKWLKFDDRAASRYRAMEDRRILIGNSKSRVIQFCPTMNFGDAVGNDVLTIQRALDEEEIPNAIYAHGIHDKLPLDSAFFYEELPKLTEDDLLIYHGSIKDPFMNKLKDFDCKIMLRYHNITPPKFYEKYDEGAALLCQNGLEQIEQLADVVDYAMADSEFNKNDLLAMKYQCGIDVVPILLPFCDYDQEPDQDTMERYSDGWINIVFIGRIAPNKCFEDIIRCFQAYKGSYNEKSRLILVGKYNKKDKYYLELQQLIEDENIQNVIFTGHTSFAEILAYYHVADVFLCMSEHEGFCVPLIEAMYLNVPVLAYNTTAIPYTIGNAGVLLDNKEPEYVAEKMNELIQDQNLRQQYLQNGKERLKIYQYDVIKKQILECIYKVIKC